MLDQENETCFSRDDFLRAIEMINSAQTLNELLEKIPESLGVKKASYHHFASIGSFDFKKLNRYHAFNLPESILSYYNQDVDRRDDPGVHVVFKKGDFVWLSDLAVDPHVVSMGRDKVAQSAVDILGDGMCIPLFGPNNRTGYAYVGFGLGKDEINPILAYQVQFLVSRFHIRYCLMLEKLQTQVKLTSREAEVLELISFGKSNPEIAIILNISTSTVTGYVSRIFLKLGVSDRVSAAMRAQTVKLNL